MERQIKPKTDEAVFERRGGVEYGSVENITYYSKTAERDTRANVILPPKFDKDKKYPALYILHGYTDNEDWMLREDVGLINMLGNLTADGEIKEMIVVLPYIFCSKEKRVCDGMNLENTLCYDNFINDLKADLMPYINVHYPVKEGRENCAITGFSQGGREALFIGVKMPATFGYVGAVCPAPGLVPVPGSSLHPGQIEEAELTFDENTLTFISAGENDDVVGVFPELYHNLLLKNGNKNLWHVVPEGFHDPSSVKQHLYNFLRLIFD